MSLEIDCKFLPASVEPINIEINGRMETVFRVFNKNNLPIFGDIELAKHTSKIISLIPKMLDTLVDAHWKTIVDDCDWGLVESIEEIVKIVNMG